MVWFAELRSSEWQPYGGNHSLGPEELIFLAHDDMEQGQIFELVLGS